MPVAATARIHPSAIVSPEAVIGERVEVGPMVVIEGAVSIGDGCVIRPFVYLIGPLEMGEGNDVSSGVTIGDRPQHMMYKGEPTRTVIGDFNTFREHVTIHRGTVASGVTVVGSHNFIMSGAHIGHDAVVGNHCILANHALVAGHSVLQDRVFMSGNSSIHQFTQIGRLSMVGGQSGMTRDLIPFTIIQETNCVVGVNIIGMRRAGIPSDQINAVRKAFHIIYRSGLMLSIAVARIERELGHVPAVEEMITFIRGARRGVLGGHKFGRDHEAAAA